MIRSFSIVLISLWLCACEGVSTESALAIEQFETAATIRLIDGNESISEDIADTKLASIDQTFLGNDETTPYPVAMVLTIQGLPNRIYELYDNQVLATDGVFNGQADIGLSEQHVIIFFNDAQDHYLYLEVMSPINTTSDIDTIYDRRADDFKIVSVKPRQCLDNQTFYEQHVKGFLETHCASCNTEQGLSYLGTANGLQALNSFIQQPLEQGSGLEHTKVDSLWNLDDTSMLRVAELLYRLRYGDDCNEESIPYPYLDSETFSF